MKIALAFPPGREAVQDYFESVFARGFDTSIHPCLCEESLPEGIDAVFAHPHSDGPECLAQMVRVFSTNPSVMFYVFTINNGRRRDSLGEHPNVNFIDNDTLHDLQDGPVDYLLRTMAPKHSFIEPRYARASNQ